MGYRRPWDREGRYKTPYSRLNPPKRKQGPRIPKPDLKGWIAMVQTPEGTSRTIPARIARKREAAAIGAMRIQASGRAYHWNSDAARRAALKRWKKVKVSKRTGRRVGLPVKGYGSYGLDLAAIRAKHTEPVAGIWYDPVQGKWCRTAFGSTWCPSERAALISLGYRRRRKGRMWLASWKITRFVPNGSVGNRRAGNKVQVHITLGGQDGGEGGGAANGDVSGGAPGDVAAADPDSGDRG